MHNRMIFWVLLLALLMAACESQESNTETEEQTKADSTQMEEGNAENTEAAVGDDAGERRLEARASATGYDLRWKIDGGEQLIYKTQMELLDKVQYNLSDAFGQDVDTEVMEQEIERLNAKVTDYNFYTIMKEESKEVVDIRIVVNQSEEAANSDDPALRNFKGVQFRGKIRKAGGIASFYLNSNQKHLLATLFQLPEHKVNVGDAWPLEMQWFSMDHNLVATSYTQQNKVKFVALEAKGDDRIAVLEYDLYASVRGKMKDARLGSPIDAASDNQVKGMAKFNITQGKWENFDVVQSLKMKGPVNSEQHLKYSLVETDKAPAEVLQYQ